MQEIDVSEIRFTIPARVLRPDAQRQAELLATIKDRHVLDPAILEEHQMFFWDAEISSDVIDSYYTHMLPNTLANFRDDALEGVAFLLGHNHRELPSGRSFNADLEQADNPPRTRVVASFYTLLGMTVNGIKTDDIVNGMRSGLTRDNSVGFFGGKHTCDIDGLDYWSWDCPHIPGRKYEVEENGVIRFVVSTFGVDDARLAEVSGVFAGSTPNAEILKAQREAEIGRIDPEAARYIEQRYRIKLPAKQRAFAGVDISESGQTPGKAERMNEQQFERLTEILVSGGVVTAEERATLDDETALVAAGKLAKRVQALEPRAADGDAYRADLVAEALAEGVRAVGQDFDSETYEEQLRGAPLKVVKRMRDDWKAAGDVRFAGGRQTNDGDETPAVAAVPLTPDAAYRS